MIEIDEGDACSYDFSYGDIIFADPPQKIGQNSMSELGREAYEDFTKAWICNLAPKLQNPGIFIIHTLPQCSYIYQKCLEKWDNLHYWSEVVWSYNFGYYTCRNWVPSHSRFLIYRKGRPQFKPDPVRIPSYRQKAGDSRADGRGRVPGSVWLDYPRLTGHATERCADLPQLPLALVLRLIKAYARTNDMVLVPFGGTGTVAKVCQFNQCRCQAIDLKPEFVDVMRKRMENSQLL